MLLRTAALMIFALAPTAAISQSTAFTPPAGTGILGAASGSYFGPTNYAGSGSNNLSYPAKPEQIRVGDSVYSSSGPVIGRIAYSDGSLAVVKSRKWALRVPVTAFGLGRAGLLLNLTPARFDRMAQVSGAPVR
ncbi:hypothetical protein [Sphingomonas crusticola]|uniref:hypothetical protein n=1 Tax=Sphingomonas crusticola TaxID=1697973 RepID=UPI000E2547D7|nr:hypothetical protein [Sphingomonas crusticola]